MEEDIINTRKEIDEIKDKISQINKEFDFIKNNIRLLGDHEKRVIELLCKDKKTIPYIAVEEFGGVKDTAYRKIYEILDEIMIFENWRG